MKEQKNGSPDSLGADHDSVTISPSDRCNDGTTCLVAKCKETKFIVHYISRSKDHDYVTLIRPI